MPVSTRGNPGRQAVLLGIGAAVGLLAIVFLVTRVSDLAESGDVQVNLGDPVFEMGNVDRLADDLEAQGPLLLPDVSPGGDRDIFLNHLGETDEEGWYAFGVRRPDQPRDCFVQYDPDGDVFVDQCDGTEYPPDGEGLPQYPVTIDGDGDLSVDLNFAARAAEDAEGGDGAESEDGEG